MPDNLCDMLRSRRDVLLGGRTQFETQWREISTYCMPRKATFDEPIPGTNLRRERMVLDSTAPRAVEMFASFLHSSLSSPYSVWFKPGVSGVDPEVTGDLAGAQWLESVGKIAAQAMQGGSTNVYNALHEVYLDLALFGTAVLYVEESRGALRFYNHHLADVAIDESDTGEVDVLLRWPSLTPRRAKQKWPDGRPLGASIDKAKPEAANEPVEFMHAIFPATDTDFVAQLPDSVRAREAPFYSAWVNLRDRVCVSYGHFMSKPFVVPRWYRARQELYGRSPAMTVFGDVLMVNRMAETVLRGAEKLVDPPLQVPDGGLISPMRLYPGGITYTDGDIDIKPLLPPGASRIELGDALIEKRQDAIREGFFTPLFLSPDSPVKTATQVMQQADERNRVTTPMVVRLQHELFDPLLRRVVQLLFDMGQLPPAPPSMERSTLSIEFVSPITASQKLQSALATTRLFEMAAQWYQVDNGVFDRVDTDGIMDVLLQSTGVPASVVSSKTRVDRVRKARQKQEDAAATQQQALAAVEAGAKLQAAQR